MGTNFYVDSTRGDDNASGHGAADAWRSLARANRAELRPGDRLLFRRGSAWKGEQLVLKAVGTESCPVVIESYGRGKLPRIDAEGLFEDALLLKNPAHLKVRQLELTNKGDTNAPRRGVHILADNAGTLNNIAITDLFIHDVNGTHSKKDNGGIIFRTIGNRVPSRFQGLRVERNIIWRVDRSGIAAQSYHANRTRWFPSEDVVIRDNWLGDIGGDGIVPWATDGALVEHNVVQGANERAGTYNAGIWPWSTDNTILRLNRASGVKTLMDGQGFDSDYNSRNTLLEFNLSHDNEGGFLLICSPGKRNTNENVGNLGTIARFNISRNDQARIFHVSAAENTLICSNAIYIRAGMDVQVMLLTDWTGWARGLDVRNNLFCCEGTARYGHQASRSEKGAYGIVKGWGPAVDVNLSGNKYIGRHFDAPEEDTAPGHVAPRPGKFNWPGPQFDPAQPHKFPRYMKEHRKWMLRLMEKQFGAAATTVLPKGD